jgi:hypothetical protein
MSTKVKPEHVYDVAFQCACLKEAGHSVEKTYLVHINNQYVRKNVIEPDKLLKAKDITNEVMTEMPNIPFKVAEMIKMIRKPKPPGVTVGSHCRSPSACPFAGLCFQNIPEGSVFELPYANRIIPMLLGQGITRLVDIQDSTQLSPRQASIVKSAKTGKAVIMRKEIKAFTDEIQWPIYLLDFETGQFCLPPWDNARPYIKIPFQFSLHVQRSKGGVLEHYEYLAENTYDPRRRVLEELIDRLGTFGSVLSYNAAFEKSVLLELAYFLPEYSVRINAVLNRMVDLIIPFRSGAYSDFRFQGSASLKKVLPVLIPGMSYNGMSISKGDDASLAYQLYVDGKTTQEEWTAQRPDLLAYCCQDTLALARICGVLFDISKGGHHE